MRRLALSVALPLLLPACGPAGESCTLAIRIERSQAQAPAGLRGFDPLNPPIWVRVKVVHASAVLEPEVFVEPLWDELPLDPETERRRLAVGVSPNAGQANPYVLQLGSEVEDALGRKVVDECGATGGIETSEGDQAKVTVVTHPGECGYLCAADEDCVGSRYCLGFECQEGRTCTTDLDCPAGARCDGLGACTALCGEALPSCPAGFTCCGAICAPSCGTVPEPP